LDDFFFDRLSSGRFNIIIIPAPDIHFRAEYEIDGRHYEVDERLVVGAVESQGAENGGDEYGRDKKGGSIQDVPADDKQNSADADPAELFGGERSDDLVFYLDELGDIEKHRILNFEF
jgi:hypothetical protein